MNDFEKAVRAGQAQASCNQAGQLSGLGGACPLSPLAEMQKGAYYHAEQAERLQDGANFLSAHPEFDEFIRLIRVGSIQL